MTIATESKMQSKLALSIYQFASMGSQLVCRACFDTDALFVTATGAEVQLADRRGAIVALGARSAVALNSVTCVNCRTRVMARASE